MIEATIELKCRAVDDEHLRQLVREILALRSSYYLTLSGLDVEQQDPSAA